MQIRRDKEKQEVHVKFTIDSLCIISAVLFLFVLLLGVTHFTKYPTSFFVTKTHYNEKTQAGNDSCSGRYIYVHDLPSQFNTDLLKNCSFFSKWFGANMCTSIKNMGLGPEVNNSHGILQGSNWYVTNQFMLELIFHNRMKSYKCLTKNSSLASAIYVPFYIGLDLRQFYWDFDLSFRDSIFTSLLKWLMEKPEWKYMNGNDHFLVAGRVTWDFRRIVDHIDFWGNNFLKDPQAKNLTVLLIESCSWCNGRDISIPYPTFFHPKSDNDLYQLQDRVRKMKRQYLFAFIGAPRPERLDSIRSEIIEQCLESKGNCNWLNCTNSKNCDDPSNTMEVFQNSTFCLQPQGDTSTRRSTFDSILAGCIPVFFHNDSAYTQYLWYLPDNHAKYSVFIPEIDIKNRNVSIEKTLLEISEKKVLEMRDEVVNLIPKVTYANPISKLENHEDAFDLAIKGVLDKVQKLRRRFKAEERGCKVE